MVQRTGRPLAPVADQQLQSAALASCHVSTPSTLRTGLAQTLVPPVIDSPVANVFLSPVNPTGAGVYPHSIIRLAQRFFTLTGWMGRQATGPEPLPGVTQSQ